jgi:hypothetical protein
LADRRPPGFNVDLGFYDSPEVLSIPRKHRAAAVGVWTLCGAYAANKLTDGLVSEEKLKELGCTPAIKTALMSTKPEPLWVSSDAYPGAIQFTRWTKWQRTCAEVKGYREAEAERKRKAREASRNATTSDEEEMSGRTIATPADARPPVRLRQRLRLRLKTLVTYQSQLHKAPRATPSPPHQQPNSSAQPFPAKSTPPPKPHCESKQGSCSRNTSPTSSKKHSANGLRKPASAQASYHRWPLT